MLGEYPKVQPNDREQCIKDALQSAELAKEEMESLKADNDKIMKQ